MSGHTTKAVLSVGTPKDGCPCREREMQVGDIAQCKNCMQVFHLRCFRQRMEQCDCTIIKDQVELKKRDSMIDFDVEIVPVMPPSKQVHPSAPRPVPAGATKTFHNGHHPAPSPAAPQPTPDAAKRRTELLATYDAEFPLNFSTEIEKNRLRVKKILFEVVLGAVEELIGNFHLLKFAFSAEKASAIAAMNTQQLYEFVKTAAHDLEAELIKLSPNPLAKDSVYLRKSRFLSIVFKQDRLNQLLVQYLLGWLSAKKLVGLPESDFSDKEKMKTYEARFWDGREMEREELVLKNYKVG